MKASSKLLAAIIVIGGAYTAASWWLGGQIEALYQERTDEISTRLNHRASSQRTYRRGIFSSSQDWIIEIPVAPADGQESIKITLHNDIRHGPYADGKLAAAIDHTRVASVQGLPQEMLDGWQLDGQLTATTVQDLRGGYQSLINVPGGRARLALPDNDVMDLAWQSMTTSVQGNSSSTELSGTLQWPGLQVGMAQADAMVQLKITGWSSRFHLNPDNEAGWITPGHVSASIDSVGLTSASGDKPMAINLSEVDYDLDLSSTGDYVDLQQNMTATGRINDLDLDQLAIEQKLQHLDKQALTQLQPIILAAMTADEPQTAVDEEALLAIAKRLADGGPSYSEDFGATLDGEQGNLSWGVSLAAKADDEPPSQLNLPLYFELLARLKGEAQLKLPQAWLPAVANQLPDASLTAEALQEQLDQLVAQGLLRKEGKSYATQGQYEQGRLTINGQTVFDLR